MKCRVYVQKQGVKMFYSMVDDMLDMIGTLSTKAKRIGGELSRVGSSIVLNWRDATGSMKSEVYLFERV